MFGKSKPQVDDIKKYIFQKDDYFCLKANHQSLARIHRSFEKSIHFIKHTRQATLKKFIFPIPLAIFALLLFFNSSDKLNAYFDATLALCALTLGINYLFFIFSLIAGKSEITKHHAANAFIGLFMLVNPGAFIWAAVIGALGASGSALKPLHSPAVIVGLIVAFSLQFWITRIYLFKRLKKVLPQKLELDYTMSISRAILREFPNDIKAQLVINPYDAKWTEQEVHCEKERWGYTFKAFMDLLLGLNLSLDDGTKLNLRIFNHRVQKVKNRKSKFKGNKFKFVYQFVLKLPGDSRLKEDSKDISEKLQKRLEQSWGKAGFKNLKKYRGTMRNHFHDGLKVNAIIRGTTVKVTIVTKTANMDRTNELSANQLLPVGVVLEVLRSITALRFKLVSV